MAELAGRQYTYSLLCVDQNDSRHGMACQAQLPGVAYICRLGGRHFLSKYRWSSLPIVQFVQNKYSI